MTAAPPIIEIRGVTRKFGALTAVDHLDLVIPRGEIFGLVGPDGAGKTTTLRMLCGLMDPTEGQIMVAGEDVAKNVDAVRDQIGYMAQRFGLYSDLTVEENMAFYGDLFGVVGKPREDLMAQLLRMTRMEPFRKRPAGKLSGGMKQKLALMCTLLHHPQILFLDEPTNGVDPVSRRDFWAILYQLVKDGLTVFVTTAYLDEAERCNRVGLMHRGKLIECDAPQRLRRSLKEPFFTVSGDQLHAVRDALRARPDVLSAEPSGPRLHLFLTTTAPPIEVIRGAMPFPAVFEPATPSLEDVFIALVSKQELPHAA
ncbi:MAG: ABC transporter ATP-binding protein [Bryobacteraceae bacterium]